MKQKQIYSLALCVITLTVAAADAQPNSNRYQGYLGFNYGDDKGGDKWVQSIRALDPAPRSVVEGNVTIRFEAPGMVAASARCWQHPTAKNASAWGHDEEIAPGEIKLDGAGKGSFIFPAGEFPHGPINVRIFAHDGGEKQDIYELQLFNFGGFKWKQGIPTNDPPAAKGLKLVFFDDFDGPLSISNDGRGARYNAHKPRHGDFSGWAFSDVLADGKPFSQVGTWLKISARKDAQSPSGRSGLLASVDMDGKGFWAKAPAYFECRFTAQSAPGTWPAFWTITHLDSGGPADELDIAECYGGVGKGNPNHPDYEVVSHFWNQKNNDGAPKAGFRIVPPIMQLGGGSYWSTTFHTYAVLLGLRETVYYFDDIEVLRHPTNEVSRDNPHCFLVNLAIGGISGWPIDLERYSNGSDMYVDYIRVYASEPLNYAQSLPLAKAEIKTDAIGLNFSVAGDPSTELMPEEAAGASGLSQAYWNNLPGLRGTNNAIHGSSGKRLAGVYATWRATDEGPAAESQIGRDWGFTGTNWKLQKAFMPRDGSLSVFNIPFEKYQVHVYLGARELSGEGSVSISSAAGGVDLEDNRPYHLGWHGGKFVRTPIVDTNAPEPGNYVVFSGNTAKEFVLNWRGSIKGGVTGVTGVQIISTP